MSSVRMGLVAAAVFVCAASGTALAQQKPRPGAAKHPRIKFDREEHDFGEGLGGPIYKTQFHFQNVGTDFLVIKKIRSSCGCTAAVPSVRRIGPGGRGTLKVKFDSGGREGLQTGSVWIYTNDPVEPVVRVRFKVDIIGAVLASDDDLHFGVFYKDESRERTFTIRYTGKEPFAITRMETSAGFIKAWYEKMKEWDKKGYVVHVRVMGKAPVGDFTETIKVYTDITKDYPVTVTLIGRVVSEVEIVPVAVRLRSHVRRRTVMVRKRRGGSFRITGVTTSLPYLTADFTTVTKGREYRVAVHLPGNAPKGVHEGRVVVRTDIPDEPEISFPVYVTVR